MNRIAGFTATSTMWTRSTLMFPSTGNRFGNQGSPIPLAPSITQPLQRRP